MNVMKISLGAFAALTGYLTLERQRLCVTSYDISTQKVKKAYKLVQLSDLHGHVFYKDNRRLIKKINALQPDAICLTGDLITSTKASGNRVIEMMKQLIKTCPIYYIRGNHELAIEKCMDWVAPYEAVLQEIGVIILRNETVLLDELSICGIEVPLSEYHYVPKTFLTRLSASDESTYHMCTSNEEMFSVLLSHTPFLESFYLNRQYDVILTGHVHGGIIQIPGVGGLLSPERKFFPKFSQGMYELKNSQLIVNRGLGCGMSMPIRVNNPPEIVVLNITPSIET